MAQVQISDVDGVVWEGADALAGQIVLVDSLTLLPGNPRHGDVGAISESLKRFGQLKPIVTDAAGVIIAGNHTFMAAQALGWTHVAAITPTDLAPQELAAFALADNRLSDLAEYDAEDLLTALHDLDDLTGTGYDTDDIDEIAHEAKRLAQPLREDAPSRPPPDSESKRGDRWTLGAHTLVCGDATDPAVYPDTFDLLFADPPYNVGVGYGDGTNDTRDDYQAWVVDWWEASRSDHAIITTGWNNLKMAYAIWDVTHLGIWHKSNSMTPGPVSMFSVWEPLVFIGDMWKTGSLRHDDYFSYPMQHGDINANAHPVPKPLRLISDLIENYTKFGDVIVDPFMGSGTTLIAAEDLGRKSWGIEIEPGYCDLIVERWEQATGETATYDAV